MPETLTYRCFMCRSERCGMTTYGRCTCGHGWEHQHRAGIRVSISGLTDGKRFCMLCSKPWPCPDAPAE